jgi:hypothetical protein
MLFPLWVMPLSDRKGGGDSLNFNAYYSLSFEKNETFLYFSYAFIEKLLSF